MQSHGGILRIVSPVTVPFSPPCRRAPKFRIGRSQKECIKTIFQKPMTPDNSNPRDSPGAVSEIKGLPRPLPPAQTPPPPAETIAPLAPPGHAKPPPSHPNPTPAKRPESSQKHQHSHLTKTLRQDRFQTRNQPKRMKRRNALGRRSVFRFAPKPIQSTIFSLQQTQTNEHLTEENRGVTQSTTGHPDFLRAMEVVNAVSFARQPRVAGHRQLGSYDQIVYSTEFC